MATAELGFKKPLSKEEKVMKKKERLTAIGKSSGCEICGMIVPLQHNLRINFHGFLVLCLLLIVQKDITIVTRKQLQLAGNKELSHVSYLYICLYSYA
ncbi:uncharacterized protein LOC110265858 isoform X3 [Arachis ipaensis]|uniref:uncharacterized protein LOC110265858 isoform X3 n=1 Tax=Arachis ipaensis TaxID=130454 RepID=UPI000A2B6F7E|nr:uncharacterized protein LOC110265858 isoform X3 [Arachis ipaensis]